MAWIPSIKANENFQGVSRILVGFVNGTDYCEQYFYPSSSNLDANWLKAQVQAKIDQLNAAYTFTSALSKGVLDTTLTPVTKTQAQTDQQTFLTDYQTLRGMKNLIDLGVKTAADADYVALQTKVKNELLPTYPALIG